MTATKLFLVLLFSAVLFKLSVPSALPQDSECSYSSDCGDGMCRQWEGDRFVCEPKSFFVAVWDADCIEKIEKKQQ